MKVKVSWTPEVRKRLWALVDNISTEVGGFGYAALEEDGTELVWYDVFLVPQRAGLAEIDYSAEGLQYAVDRASKDNVLGKPDHVWVSWHSHNTMKAFWSGTDEGCIDTYGAGGMPVLLSFVGNHDHEYRARLDFFGVRHHGMTLHKVTVDDIEIALDGDEPVDPFVEAIRRELDEHVKKPHYRTGWRGGQARGAGGKSGTTTEETRKTIVIDDADEGDYENVAGLVLPRGSGWQDQDDAAAELEGGCWW